MQGTHDLAMNHCLAVMGSGFKATKSHTMALEPPCWTSSLTQRSPEQAAKTNPLQTGQGISDGRAFWRALSLFSASCIWKLEASNLSAVVTDGTAAFVSTHSSPRASGVSG